MSWCARQQIKPRAHQHKAHPASWCHSIVSFQSLLAFGAIHARCLELPHSCVSHRWRKLCSQPLEPISSLLWRLECRNSWMGLNRDPCAAGGIYRTRTFWAARAQTTWRYSATSRSPARCATTPSSCGSTVWCTRRGCWKAPLLLGPPLKIGPPPACDRPVSLRPSPSLLRPSRWCLLSLQRPAAVVLEPAMLRVLYPNERAAVAACSMHASLGCTSGESPWILGDLIAQRCVRLAKM